MVVFGASSLRHLAVALALASVACTALVDLTGFSGEREPPPATPDGASPSDGGGGTNDTDPPPSEAGAESAAGRFCDPFPGAIFCTDFDGVSRASLPLEERNGAFDLNDDTAVSAPTAARVELDTPASDTGKAALRLNVEKPGPTLRIAFALQVLAHSSDYTETLMIRSMNGPSPCELFIILNEDRASLRAGCPGSDLTQLGTLPFDRWMNVDITVDLTKGGGTLTIDQQTWPFPMPAKFADEDISVTAGVYYAKAASGPIRLRLDNVVVTR